MFKKGFLLSILATILAVAYLWFNAGQLNLSSTASQAESDKLKISFLDVGQGDAILIQSPQGQKILIDGGESSDKLLEDLGQELGWFDRGLNYVFLTHPHADHVKGLNGLFDRFKIEQAVGTLVNHNSSAYKFWLDSLVTKKIKVINSFANRKFNFDNGLELTILSPDEDLKGRDVDNLNNSSLVMLLTYGQTKFLLMGDAEEPIEKDLLSRGVDLQAQVIKIGHHGSTTSTSQEFLEAVGPQMAVISVGANNDFGHPHVRILNRLERAGIKILRTDQLGTIRFLSDGTTLELLD